MCHCAGVADLVSDRINLGVQFQRTKRSHATIFFWGYIPELMEGTKSHVYTRKEHPNNNESPLLFHEITIFRLKVMSKINVHSYFLCVYIYI